MNCTPPIPLLSAALAAIVTAPPSVALAVGAVIATEGGTLSTVTVTAVAVVTLPAVSRAIAASVCAPLLAPAVFHVTP